MDKKSINSLLNNITLSQIAEHKFNQDLQKIKDPANMSELESFNYYYKIISQIEKPLIKATLIKCGGNKTHAANLLGISRVSLIKKIKTYL